VGRFVNSCVFVSVFRADAVVWWHLSRGSVTLARFFSGFPSRRTVGFSVFVVQLSCPMRLKTSGGRDKVPSFREQTRNESSIVSLQHLESP